MKELDRVVVISAVISVIFGIFVSLYFLWPHTSYSTIFLYPGYPNYVKPGSIVKFRYGVVCHENKRTNYTLSIYVGGSLVKVERFGLNPDQTLVRNESVLVPKDAKFPLKVSLVLITSNKEKYEVHFWLKSIRNG